MKMGKKGLLIIKIISTLLGILVVTSLILSYKVTAWVKNIDQIQLGDLEMFKRYSLTINIFAVCAIILVVLTTLFSIRFVPGKTRKIKAVLSLFLSVGIGSYVFLCLFIYYNLDGIIKLNHLVYQPKKIDQSIADKTSLLYTNIEDIELRTSDNIKLNGWLIKNTSAEKAPLLIYFGGSGEEVSDILSIFEGLDGWSVALINYRSYGLSEGEPSKNSLNQDANAIYDYFSKRSDIDNKKIVSM
ncbi:hypothetical protein A8709_27455 [Paenibacillus pectinilyticus]|uniref:Alpha/beta hydrolase n=1 Tax=Paenibacillus pectinilyticus TaxID=512399 RepID=A0A1C1A9J9_9BACL|nr:alpha/beta hydrolase [Paenibacillus pectinilyticus]OCT17267.1 hypothetical protein A8709_27455 [Paenibacillus pectinilyticus]